MSGSKLQPPMSKLQMASVHFQCGVGSASYPGSSLARIGGGDEAVPTPRPIVSIGVTASRRQHLGAVLLLLSCSPLSAAVDNPHSIVYSKHNLSVSGKGDIRSATESDICIFCHAPHTATGQTALWNRDLPATVYEPYKSSSLKATVGQPTGASKLCLSCHDGTVALGRVANRPTPIPMRGGTALLPPGRSRVGTDLAGHHPISFTYDSALVTAKGELRNPQTFQREVRLDKGQQLQCTSCHDPHNDQYGQFLVEDNAGSALCLECHIPKQWNTSSHATSRADWNGVGRNPWPHTNRKTVAANGCENCHTPHQAGTKPQLLNLAPVEENCFNCHNGNVAAKDIRKEFDKPSAHPVAATSSLHVATEDPVYGPRHTSCVDCHNPHATQSSPPSGLHASGSLVAVKGMNSAGRTVQTISQESELCYRCHAESLGRGPSPIRRQLVATNLRLQFQPANASFHPIETAGKSSFVPSLIAPLTTASLITCTDCHNNNQGPGAGGTGPRGPHGSSFPPLLERQLILTDMTPESSASYALCYKCHSRDSILGDESFKATNSQGQPRGHRYHIVDRQTACTTCHQPHGVQLQAHLINFNTQYVSASSNGRLEYVSHGPSGGTCSLTCHVAGGSYDHPATTYPITASSFLRKARPGNRGQ